MVKLDDTLSNPKWLGNKSLKKGFTLGVSGLNIVLFQNLNMLKDD